MRKLLLAAAAVVMVPSAAQAAPCIGVTFGAGFASYSCNSLGTPTGVTGRLGGINFLNNNTLLVGGEANVAAGYIAQIGVTRDAQNHIIGFSAPSSFFASAPYIDGGLAYGPNGVLFATGFPNNTLLQYKPGSSAPDRTDVLGANVSSVGAIVFVPTGFGGAGQMKILGYSGGGFANGTLTPDGSGTFSVVTGPNIATLSGGPEGAVYVSGANAGFGGINSLLVSEYSVGRVGAYQVDASGNPIVASRTDFITGLSGAEGAVIDPLTGDFLFSTFGSGNEIFVIRGFVTPPQPGGVPEPTTWAMLLMGFGAIGTALRRRKDKAPRVRFA